MLPPFDALLALPLLELPHYRGNYNEYLQHAFIEKLSTHNSKMIAIHVQYEKLCSPIGIVYEHWFNKTCLTAFLTR